MYRCTITTEDNKRIVGEGSTKEMAHGVAIAKMNAAAAQLSLGAMSIGNDPIGLFEKEASYELVEDSR